MAEEKAEVSSTEPEQKDLSQLADIEKFKAASHDDKEQYIKAVQSGDLSRPEEAVEPSTESKEESSSEPNEEASTTEDSKQVVDKEQSDSQDDPKSEDDSDKSDKSEESQLSKLTKSYKSLEAEFTRRNQASKRKEEELQNLKDEINRLKSQMNVKTSEFDQMLEQMKDKSPEAAKLFQVAKEAAVKEAKAEFDKELQSIKSEISSSKLQENLRGFQHNLDEFFDSPLGALEPELMEILRETYETDDELLAAASQDSGLWNKFKEKLLAKHYLKAAELEAKASQKSDKRKPSISSKDRDKEINESKGAGKSTTSKKVDDSDSAEAFNKLSQKQKEEFLKRKGLWKI